MTKWQDPYGPIVGPNGAVVLEYDPNNPAQVYDDEAPHPPNAPAAVQQGGPPPPPPPPAVGSAPEGESGVGFVDGTVVEVMRWVDGDKDRARVALDVESAKDSPRKGLVVQLTGVLNDD